MLDNYKSTPTRPPGARRMYASTPSTTAVHFNMDFLHDMRKRSSLSVSDASKYYIFLVMLFFSLLSIVVPVFDLTEWYTGKNKNQPLDFKTILSNAPRWPPKEEIPEDSIVGVIHSLGIYQTREGKITGSFNIYAVLLLVIPNKTR